MKGFLNFLLLVGLIISGIYFYRKYQERIQRKKELEELRLRELEKKRQQFFDFYQSKLDRMKNEAKLFANHLEFATGYFSNYQVQLWKQRNSVLVKEVNDNPFENIQLTNDEVNIIKKFLDTFKNAESYRNAFNKQFIQVELNNYKIFFDNIEGNKLDIQQRTAIVTDEDNNIIIAGAGSGKTLTIIGKIKYLLDRYKITPEEILLISFTMSLHSLPFFQWGLCSIEAITPLFV